MSKILVAALILWLTATPFPCFRKRCLFMTRRQQKNKQRHALSHSDILITDEGNEQSLCPAMIIGRSRKTSFHDGWLQGYWFSYEVLLWRYFLSILADIFLFLAIRFTTVFCFGNAYLWIWILDEFCIRQGINLQWNDVLVRTTQILRNEEHSKHNAQTLSLFETLQQELHVWMKVMGVIDLWLEDDWLRLSFCLRAIMMLQITFYWYFSMNSCRKRKTKCFRTQLKAQSIYYFALDSEILSIMHSTLQLCLTTWDSP